jgi:hypothetical protein
LIHLARAVGTLAAMTKTPASAGVSPPRAVRPSPKSEGRFFLISVHAGLLDDGRPLADLGLQVRAERADTSRLQEF